jgi:hypothetical protein
LNSILLSKIPPYVSAIRFHIINDSWDDLIPDGVSEQKGANDVE